MRIKKSTPKKGLTDKELVLKYETGGKVNFEKSIKKMLQPDPEKKPAVKQKK